MRLTPQEWDKTRQDDPNSRQVKSLPRGEKKEKKGKLSQLCSREGLWEASGSHLGLILNPPKTNSGAYFEDVRSIFYIALNLLITRTKA